MFLIRPIVALLIAQGLKILFESLAGKRFDFKRVLGSGGMPSSHAAITVALSTQLGKVYGVHDPLFATAVIFTIVVLYDAAGIRRAAGKQAEVLNKIMGEIMSHKKITETRLKELLGHTPVEVIVGGLLGFVVGFW